MNNRPHNTEFNQYALPRNLINTIKRKFILTNCTSALQVSPPKLQNENILFVGTMVPPLFPAARGNQKAPTSRSYKTLGSGTLSPNHGHCGCLRPPSPRYWEWRAVHRTHNLREQEIIIFFFFFLYQAYKTLCEYSLIQSLSALVQQALSSRFLGLLQPLL